MIFEHLVIETEAKFYMCIPVAISFRMSLYVAVLT